MIKELKLPTTYEAIKAELIGSGGGFCGPTYSMEFVKPVEDAEKVLAEIVAQMVTCPPKTDPHVKLERWINGLAPFFGPF